MSIEEQLALARKIAVTKHAGQTDKQGMPYIGHPFRVAASLADPGLKVVALLHDVLEDTDATAKELAGAGIDPAYVSMVEQLTHDEAVPYDDYIRSLLAHPAVIPVKLADIRDNLRPGCPSDLKERYLKALAVLEPAFKVPSASL